MLCRHHGAVAGVPRGLGPDADSGHLCVCVRLLVPQAPLHPPLRLPLLRHCRSVLTQPPPTHTHTQTYTGTGLVWKKLKSCQFHATPCKSCKMINKLECCKTSPIVENDHHFSLVFVLFFPKQCRAHPHFTYHVHVHYPV